MSLHGQEGVWSTPNALNGATDGLVVLQNHVILLSERKEANVVGILELGLRSLMETLFLHAEGKLVFFANLMHGLVSTHSFIVHHGLHLCLIHLLLGYPWLLNRALFQVIIHQFTTLMKHRLRYSHHLLLLLQLAYLLLIHSVLICSWVLCGTTKHWDASLWWVHM